jgi:hypothetical protein
MDIGGDTEDGCTGSERNSRASVKAPSPDTTKQIDAQTVPARLIRVPSCPPACASAACSSRAGDSVLSGPSPQKPHRVGADSPMARALMPGGVGTCRQRGVGVRNRRRRRATPASCRERSASASSRARREHRGTLDVSETSRDQRVQRLIGRSRREPSTGSRSRFTSSAPLPEAAAVTECRARARQVTL